MCFPLSFYEHVLGNQVLVKPEEKHLLCQALKVGHTTNPSHSWQDVFSFSSEN